VHVVLGVGLLFDGRQRRGGHRGPRTGRYGSVGSGGCRNNGNGWQCDQTVLKAGIDVRVVHMVKVVVVGKGFEAHDAGSVVIAGNFDSRHCIIIGVVRHYLCIWNWRKTKVLRDDLWSLLG